MHTILFIISPILSLYSVNLDEVPVTEIVIPVLVAAGIGILLVLLFCLMGAGVPKASVIASCIVVLVYVCGYLMTAVSYYSSHHSWAMSHFGPIWVVRLGKGLISLIWLMVFPALIWWIFKAKSIKACSMALNIAAASLVAIPVWSIGCEVFAEFPPGSSRSVDQPLVVKTSGQSTRSPKKLPNIYYIILDGYGGQDTLKRLYDYDNRPFLDALKQRGFYVARRSHANYCQTAMSLASSLNSRYLNFLKGVAGPGRGSVRLLTRMVQDSEVVHQLKSYGYTFVYFETRSSSTNMARQADVFVSTPNTCSEFVEVLFHEPPLAFVKWSVSRIWPSTMSPNKYQRLDKARHQILYNLNILAAVTDRYSPTFALCHILAPHPPFVFDKDGNAVNLGIGRRFWREGSQYHQMKAAKQNEYLTHYRDQLSFLNTKVLESVDGILSRSSERPIIILQGDHGPGLNLDWDSDRNTDIQERMSILNAYLVPPECQSHLYEKISPVNTFRLVLGCLLGHDASLLPDKSYFSVWSRPFEFIDVTSRLTAETAESE